MDFGESDLSLRYAAVCHNISFANHSCYPNAGYAADEETVTVKLLPIRDIDLRQEICISYTSLNTRVVRLGILKRNYSFRCTCTECADTLENKAKEETRKFIDSAMTLLDKRMDEWTTGCPQSRATNASRDIEYCMQILHAMDGEKAYYGERMQVVQHLVHIYGGLGAVKDFKKWSFMTAWLFRLGGSPMYLIWEFWYANPSAFALWNTVADLKETAPQGKDTSYTI